MKKIVIFVLLSNLTWLNSFSQSPRSKFNVAMVLKFTYLPLISELAIPGTMEVTKDSIFFRPAQCSDAQKKLKNFAPCNGHHVKSMAIDFREIEKIKNRGYLFIIPNRLFIVDRKNNGYLFITYHRRKIKRAYREFLANDKQTKQGEKVALLMSHFRMAP